MLDKDWNYWYVVNERIKEENEVRWQVLFSEVRAERRKHKIRKIYAINC